MRKNKKRLQMQTKPSKRAVYNALDDSVAMGILQVVGHDENGDPLYTLAADADKKIEVLKKTLPKD